ncbi:MAG: site-2 protease family protein, partial [Akkermansia sp.]|nr:site-2 protease family protein [Akkermansia sp.]
METLLSILQSIGIIFIVIMFFNIMIFVHELGHFLAGKWRGAYIDRFQIWFGKPIWSKKIWGVQWGLGWIPAGGFVSLPQLEDMQNIEGKAELPADLKPLKAKDKVIIAAAGPLFSLLLAYAFACIVWCVGKPVTELPNTQIGYLVDGAPAAQAGLQPGDIIRKIDGQPVTKWMGNMEGVTELIALSEHEKIN